ncbi:MAG: hypothetical protein K5857_11065, partial [Lachnospiraceae bacterium]|nr:hypothetical protein [Lachnospiraceae bacterium]
VYELSSGAAGISDNQERISGIRRIADDLYDRIKRRREVLFLPFKDEYWGTMDDIYRLMDKDPDTDVCLVPIPYYYKDFKHRLHDMQYRTDKYPKDLKITKYDEYDLKLRHPDMIIIQNPYDDVNDESSVPPYFFSDRLLEHTDDLVYVPWFETYDIKRENEREYINMKHYCTVPGVVNADHILLPTQILKETYVDKLTDLAGDKTRQIWEEKILIRGTDEEREVLGVREEAAVEDDKRERKKTMVYYPDFSDIMLFGDEAVSKVRSSVKTFVDSGAALDFVIIKAGLIEDKLKELKPEVYRGFMNVLEEAARNDNIRVVDEGEIDPEKLVKECTAYYGDGGHLAHMFRNAGKPVMIQDYSIQGEEE